MPALAVLEKAGFIVVNVQRQVGPLFLRAVAGDTVLFHERGDVLGEGGVLDGRVLLFRSLSVRGPARIADAQQRHGDAERNDSEAAPHGPANLREL